MNQYEYESIKSRNNGSNNSLPLPPLHQLFLHVLELGDTEKHTVKYRNSIRYGTEMHMVSTGHVMRDDNILTFQSSNV